MDISKGAHHLASHRSRAASTGALTLNGELGLHQREAERAKNMLTVCLLLAVYLARIFVLNSRFSLDVYTPESLRLHSSVAALSRAIHC